MILQARALPLAPTLWSAELPPTPTSGYLHTTPHPTPALRNPASFPTEKHPCRALSLHRNQGSVWPQCQYQVNSHLCPAACARLPAPACPSRGAGAIWGCQGSAQFTLDLQHVKILVYIDAASHVLNVEARGCEARDVWLCPGGSS